MDLSYKIEVFEGPLDLLLHLISKHKLNINDIPIFELVEQYLNYVRSMQDADLDVASEFIEMAARLVHIKTVSLLPVYEEAELLKKELTGELLEYRDCKLIAAKLSEQTDGFNTCVREPAQISSVQTEYNRFHDVSVLYGAYMNAVGKKLRRLPPPASAFSAIVEKRIVSVGSKIRNLLNTLIPGKKRKLKNLFSQSQSRSDLVATFLALLELCKSKRVYVDGDGDSAEITLISSEGEINEYEFD